MVAEAEANKDVDAKRKSINRDKKTKFQMQCFTFTRKTLEENESSISEEDKKELLMQQHLLKRL